MASRSGSVAVVDWLNLSIKLKSHGREFGPTIARLLVEVSEREALQAGYELSKIHFVAESFGQGVQEAIEQNLSSTLHKTRTAKEQADLKIAVITMDHLHQVGGPPGLFIIATGDQDFVPLVERILEEKSEVLLIAASLSDLSPEYRRMVAQPHVKLLGLLESEVVPALRASASSKDQAVGVAVLLRIVFDGGVLGGDQSRNSRSLSGWHLGEVRGREEERLQGWIREFTDNELRRVAVPGNKTSINQAQMRRRVYLDFKNRTVGRLVSDFDWILRRCDPQRQPQSKGTLGIGRFSDDDGSRVGAAVHGLVKVGWLTERPDGSLESTFPWGADGFLEPLLRLLAAVEHESYEAGGRGVDRDKVFRALSSQPLGALPSRRGGRAAGGLIEFGRRLGVIDAYPAGDSGFVLGSVSGHPLVRNVDTIARFLVDNLSLSESTRESALLERIRQFDASSIEPLFGFDSRDRVSVLRAMKRAGLTRLHQDGADKTLLLKPGEWVNHLLF